MLEETSASSKFTEEGNFKKAMEERRQFKGFEKRQKTWLAEAFEGLSHQFTWRDLLSGVVAAMLIAGLLLGFRFQAIPKYKVGDIAGQQVIAPQDAIYEDVRATAVQREDARGRTPALYELEVYLIDDLEKRLDLAFAAARQILSAHQISIQGKLRVRQASVLEWLTEEIGEIIPPRFLLLLLEHNFDATFEKKIFMVLDPVLRSGIVADPELFRLDVKKGIILRDKATLIESPLVDSSRIRSMEAAKEYLRQFHLEFAELSAPERADLFSFLDTLLIPTLTSNAAETESRRDAAAARVPPVEIHLKKGKVVVRKGEEVSPRAEANLAALRHLHEPRPLLGRLFGLFFFAASFLYALWRYLAHDRRRYPKARGYTMLVAVVIVLVLIVMRLLTALADIVGEYIPLATLQDPSDLYFVIPFALGGMLLTLLVDLNVGLIISMVISALAGLFYGATYIAVYALIGSLASIYSVSQYQERSDLIRSGLWVGMVNALAAFGIHLVRQDIFIWSDLLTPLAMGALSGILAAALTSISLPSLESLFKIDTHFRLLELSNLNTPILRRLAVEAPGTYHHSLMVGNLAEAAAEAIGANPLLARVGAYYHDLGKVMKPKYFSENQGAGVNKHASLAASMSRLVLASHVKDGLELAKQAGLRETIVGMFAQHHGTRVMTYFYHKAKELAVANGQKIREENFRYPGPKPQSKEAAILMMADTIEAASRTLVSPSTLQIQRMIDRLIEDLLADNQLDECDITIRDIRLVKESFLKVLNGAHHFRIEYPGYDFTLPDNKAHNLKPEDLKSLDKEK